MTYKSKKELTLKAGGVVPAGTSLSVMIEKERPTLATVYNAEFEFKVRSTSLYALFDEFMCFTQEEITEALYDGRCPSLSGEEVEPDGWDSEGYPSLLLAAGLI